MLPPLPSAHDPLRTLRLQPGAVRVDERPAEPFAVLHIGFANALGGALCLTFALGRS